MKKESKGQQAVETAILLGLIFIVSLSVVVLFGDHLANFFANSGVMRSSNAIGKSGTVSYATTGNTTGNMTGSGATYDSPVRKCTGGKCTLEFGEITLSNIPEDFNAYVNSTGSSGATSMIKDLFDQIGSQLQAKGLTQQSEKFKKLAVSAHNIAVLEKYFEELPFQSGMTADKIRAMLDDQSTVFPKLTGYDDTYVAYPDNSSYFTMFHSLEVDWTCDDTIYSSCQGSVANGAYTLDGKFSIVANFKQQLKDILDDPTIGQPLKNITNELVWDIDTMCNNFDDAMHLGADPVTIKDYNASEITHFDGALVCVAGENTDTGTACH